MTTCRCGAEIEKPKTGRPAWYCSTACRRAAEYELRRWQSLLLRAQKEEQTAALAAVVGRLGYGSPGERERAALAFWQGEVDRLAGLLDDALGEHEEGSDG